MLRVAKDLEVLMSLHDEWAAAILNRTKRWEFRRRCGLCPGMRVWIYVTAPRREIVGFFTVGEIRRVSAYHPDPGLARAGKVTPTRLREYFEGLDSGFAIEVTRPKRLRYGVCLARGKSGPMSYRFLDPTGRDRRLVRRLADAAQPSA